MGKSAWKIKTHKLSRVPGWILETLGWPIGCPGVEFWHRFWGRFFRFCRSCSFQAIFVVNLRWPGMRAVCVGLVWQCVKIGLVCCCGFADEIWRGAVSSVRIPLVCSEWWLAVESWCERHNCFTGGWDGSHR
jgi:hypothetical protein